jgi:hypothetical protein
MEIHNLRMSAWLAQVQCAKRYGFMTTDVETAGQLVLVEEDCMQNASEVLRRQHINQTLLYDSETL